MAFPYVPVFLALLLAYMVYSQWARLDSRFPIAGALVLLVAAALVDAAGDDPAANILAEFVFFLLAAGIVLLLLDHARAGSGSTSASTARDAEATDPPQERQGPPEETLDRAQQ